MAHFLRLFRNIAAIACLPVLATGCAGPSDKPVQQAKGTGTQLPEQKPFGSQPGGLEKPFFPFPPIPPAAGTPSGTPPGSVGSPAIPASPAAAPQTNTRPVGPLGVRQITLGLNDLRQAGALLLAYYNENNGWPRDTAELQTALREMPHVYKAIQAGDYVFVPAKNPSLSPGSQTVIIYERLPDKSGVRLVLFGDGSVKRMSVAEFSQLKVPVP